MHVFEYERVARLVASSTFFYHLIDALMSHHAFSRLIAVFFMKSAKYESDAQLWCKNSTTHITHAQAYMHTSLWFSLLIQDSLFHPVRLSILMQFRKKIPNKNIWIQFNKWTSFFDFFFFLWESVNLFMFSGVCRFILKRERDDVLPFSAFQSTVHHSKMLDQKFNSKYFFPRSFYK